MTMIDLLLVFAGLLLCHSAAGQTQYRCVASCGGTPEEIGVFNSIRECCTENNGGGFVRLGTSGSNACTDCLPFRVVDPQIMLSFDPEFPAVGEPFTGRCVAMIDSEVSGSIQLEWRDAQNEVINSSTGDNNMAEATFTIDPFKAVDSTLLGGYSCRAMITAEDDTHRYQITLTRNILFAASPGFASITSSGDFSPGSQFRLTCTVSGVSPAPNIFWSGPQGQIGSSTADLQLGEIMSAGDSHSRTLVFRSLSSDQAGTYVCSNTATSPATVQQDVFLGTWRINTTEPARLNRPYTALCEVSVPPGLSATVQVVLLDPAGTALATATGIDSAEATFLLPSLQESNLGQYTCRSTVFSNRLNSPVTSEQSFPVEVVQRCADEPSFCSGQPNTQCVDTAQGPSCICVSGFMLGFEGQCTNIDECALEVDDCDDNAECSDSEGGFSCACQPGYSGNGVNCDDTDECRDESDDCSDNASCSNTEGSFTCQCLPGFEGDGRTCVDRDECRDESDDCSDNASCSNTEGSFICQCLPGFEGDGRTCVDRDECRDESDDCSDNASCSNTEGSFMCQCLPGFEGDGRTCVAVEPEEPEEPQRNECESGEANCDDNADCTDMEAGFSCACREGFEGDGTSCSDVNECEQDTDNCDRHAVCYNLPGSFHCVCRYGFIGNGFTCKKLEPEVVPDDPEEESSSRSHSRSHSMTRTTPRSRTRTTPRSRTRSNGEVPEVEVLPEEPEMPEEPELSEVSSSSRRSKSKKKSRSSRRGNNNDDDDVQQEPEVDEMSEVEEESSSRRRSKSKKKSRSSRRGNNNDDDDVQQEPEMPEEPELPEVDELPEVEEESSSSRRSKSKKKSRSSRHGNNNDDDIAAEDQPAAVEESRHSRRKGKRRH